MIVYLTLNHSIKYVIQEFKKINEKDWVFFRVEEKGKDGGWGGKLMI